MPAHEVLVYEYRDELEEYAVIMALTKIVSKDIYEK